MKRPLTVVRIGGVKMPKQYRFFYHYYKGKRAMSVHFKGTCHVVNDVVCNTLCETKWNKRQPRLVMQGFASEVEIDKGVAYIR